MNSKHNPKQDVLVVNGYVVPIEDIAGDEINFVRSDEGRYEAKVGVGGGTQFMRKANDNGILTFSVWQGSETHKFLTTIYERGMEVLACSYKKGGVEMPPIVGSQGVLSKLVPSSSTDGKVAVEIITANVVGA